LRPDRRRKDRSFDDGLEYPSPIRAQRLDQHRLTFCVSRGGEGTSVIRAEDWAMQGQRVAEVLRKLAADDPWLPMAAGR
jgi:hypothetical protein